MLHTRSWTKRPREALLQLDIELGLYLFRIGGSSDASRGNSEIPPSYYFSSNYRFAPKRQCLVGSLSGADASQKVTEAFTKVGYPGMEIQEIVQAHKPALLRDLQVEQSRKWKLVNRPCEIGRRKIIG